MTAPFTHRLRVRYHECDARGEVAGATWFTYFDVTMTELFRALFGSYQALFDHGCDVLVVASQATFLAPARFDELVDVELRVARLGTTSIAFEYTARRDGDDLVRGRVTQVFVDLAGHGKVEIPADMRAALVAHERAA
jgi:acyl-CoA thioester hydrolase